LPASPSFEFDLTPLSVARRHHVNNDLSKRRDFFRIRARRATLCVTATRQNRNTSLEYVRQLRKG
jgi:hypothetical protein